jgi:hypothetical protein
MNNPMIKAAIAHSIPGRLRLKFATPAAASGAGDLMATRLGSVEGIQSIDSRGASRSLVICYVPRVLGEEPLIDRYLPSAGIDISGFDPKTTAQYGLTAVGRSIVNTVSKSNKAVRNVFTGALDLTDLFPLTLVAFGLLRVARGQLQPMPWYNLLYYGYSVFYTLHAKRAPASPDARETLKERYVKGEITKRRYLDLLADIGERRTAARVKPRV